jgi:hypothetical protein
MDVVMWFRKYARKFIKIVTIVSSLQRSKLFISILILLVIGLHSLPILQGLLGKKQTFWPFMSWTMYRGSYSGEQPVQTVIRRTIAITAMGQEVDVESAFVKQSQSFFNLFPWGHVDDSETLGLRYFSFARFYLKPMWRGDFSTAISLADRMNRNRDVPIVEFRLENDIYTVSDRGIIEEFKPFISYRIVD